MNHLIKLLIVLTQLFFSGNSTAQNSNQFELEHLPKLPSINSESESLGYAGMLSGSVNDVIIAAGGANFPNGAPWKGGTKVWSDLIFIYENGSWRQATTTLPEKLAYSASVSLDDGILCIGGNNSNHISSKVFLMSYNENSKEVEITEYPALPEPLAFSAATKDDQYIYLIGGQTENGTTNSFYRFNIQKGTHWEQMEDFPGAPRAFHTVAIQQTSTNKKLFVIGGRNELKGKKSQTLTSYLSFDLVKNKWVERELLIEGKSRVLMGASSHALGSMHILVYGGSDEVIFDELESLILAINSEDDETIKNQLIVKKEEILNNHPGFSNEIIAFNTITNKWFSYQQLDKGLAVTASSFFDNDKFTIVSGEISPGIRTPEVLRFNMIKKPRDFGLVNYIVLIFYLLLSVVIGVFFSRKQKSTKDYFTGGGRIPWWASGLSVFGTLLSAITFMAIPAKSFATDWSFFFLNITAIIITPLIAFVFIPYYNKLKIKTAYEFLETRFNYTARAFGSLSFILFQLGRIGIVLLLPALAISIVTGIPVETSIIIMGVLCIVYTTFGGIEAVIWTDVMQVIVLLGGSILAVYWMITHIDLSVNEMISIASQNNKFNIANMDLNFAESTFWVVVIGGLASAMVTQGTDQTIVQRFLTSSDVKKSQKTLYTNAILTLPATIIFFGIGTLLFIFYSEMPTKLSPSISNNDSIFPWYIVNELPIGISGLLIAGVFSAAMSSISSSLNSVSTAYCNDFHIHYRSETTDKSLLKVARITTLVTGLIGLTLALIMANSNIQSLWDQFYRFLGLFTGGLGGMFLLGMLTKKANATGTLMGLIFSAILIWYVSVFTNISFLMYSFIGVASCFVFGYVFSFLFEQKKALTHKS